MYQTYFCSSKEFVAGEYKNVDILVVPASEIIGFDILVVPASEIIHL